MKILALSLFLFLTVAILSITAMAIPPTVTTVEGYSNFHTEAYLHGLANPNGGATTGWFRYSTVNPGACSDTFGIRAPETGGTSLGSGTSAVAFDQTIHGTSEVTTYYFCAIAQNSSGTGFGAVLSFTTPGLPTMVTLPPTNVTGYSATLNGTVNPNGSVTQVHFFFDGSLVPNTTGPMVSGTEPVLVSIPVPSGLGPGFTYSYAITGQNFEGTSTGQSVSFTTTNELPRVSGTVTYGNAIGAPSPRYVSNVSVVIQFSGYPGTTTGPPGPTAGQYSIPAFCFGFCFNTPSKTGGVNGITSFDAALVAKHVADVQPLTGNQLIVADVSGDGTISSFDAALIARYASSLGSLNSSTGTWRFEPGSYTYHVLAGNYTGQDFTALLMGEVSGNWTNTGARPR